MSHPACPMCELTEVLDHPELWECVTCGHEWKRAPEPEKARVVKDAHGTVLTNGDLVMLIKDLPLKGSSQVLKGGSKSKPILLVDGDHEISCRIEGVAIGLKACFVKKV
jgi:protein PhnA